MWNVRPDRDNSRGGFQDRDVGRSNFREDFGPDYGIDFARFADDNDPQKDSELQEAIKEKLSLSGSSNVDEVIVRNGFVILKGFVLDEITKEQIGRSVSRIEGVVYVISTLKVSHPS